MEYILLEGFLLLSHHFSISRLIAMLRFSPHVRCSIQLMDDIVVFDGDVERLFLKYFAIAHTLTSHLSSDRLWM